MHRAAAVSPPVDQDMTTPRGSSDEEAEDEAEDEEEQEEERRECGYVNYADDSDGDVFGDDKDEYEGAYEYEDEDEDRGEKEQSSAMSTSGKHLLFHNQ